MSAKAPSPSSVTPKSADSHIPYCRDQGIPYLVGSTLPGVMVQPKLFTVPAGNVFDFAAQGLISMADTNYAVLLQSHTAPATVTSGNAPFALSAGGETITAQVDKGSTQTSTIAGTAAVLTSANTQTYALNNGQTLTVAIDGGAVQTLTFAATAASIQSAAQTFALANGNTLTLTIDGGGTQTFTFNTGSFVDITHATAAEVAAVIAATITGATAAAASGKVVITSSTKGTGSNVHVTGGSGNGALGFSTTAVAGTGDAVNIAAATAAEVVTAANARLTGVTASTSTNHVRFTSNTLGTGSNVHVTGGTANTALGFSTTAAAGSGDAVNLGAMTAAELATVLNRDITGQVATVSGSAVVMASDTLGLPSYIQVTGGTANGTIGFSTSLQRGQGTAADAPANMRTRTQFTLVGPNVGDVLDIIVVGKVKGQV